MKYIRFFATVGMGDVGLVGGKNASLGEMYQNLTQLGINIPNGFSTTRDAYALLLAQNRLAQRIDKLINGLDIEDVAQLQSCGKAVRELILNEPLPSELEVEIVDAYRQLSEKYGENSIDVAVRSSATAEDLPEASFAGQQETFLNVRTIDQVKLLVKEVYASLFNDRAISYRVHHGFDHADVSLSVGIQKMVRSETASSGVMFTLDTESGFRDVIFITSSYGLGETVVQGAVNPDEFYVHKSTFESGRPAILRRNLGSKAIKMVYSQDQSDSLVETVKVEMAQRNCFSLSDEDVNELARQALIIEKHYQRAMDIEWAKDGDDGLIYIVQARPETVKSRSGAAILERYLMKEKGSVIVEGRSIGQKIGSGVVKIIHDISDMDQLNDGDILVTDMTDPDWEPVMKIASAIVTDRGGRTCHAAIVARELGIPAVVGCGDATDILKDGCEVTVSCAEGDTGFIYNGLLDFELKENTVDSMPELGFNVMMNVGNPDRAFDFRALPNAGIGLARLEFIINRMIGVHPKALLNFDTLPPEVQIAVENRISGYSSPVDFFIKKMSEGMATLAAAFYPKPVIIRLSDFRSNEYANLIGGSLYEPDEENPMLGFRGASRYISETFRDCFYLECEAIKYVRDEMGFTNIQIMVPFVRTVGEAKQVVDLLAERGLKRGENDLKVVMMCELPANAILADQFLEYFDGFSIGSNDLTQLTLGLDRDSGTIAHLFDEQNEAVLVLLSNAIESCKKAGKYVGICGQGPSDYPDFAKWLADKGIDSISFNPDSVLDTWFYLSESDV